MLVGAEQGAFAFLFVRVFTIFVLLKNSMHALALSQKVLVNLTQKFIGIFKRVEFLYL